LLFHIVFLSFDLYFCWDGNLFQLYSWIFLVKCLLFRA
jgi:hypothetical protein